jgi:uncharacterized protein (TIGR00725 family)
MKKIISVIGHDKHAKKIHLEIAEEVGKEIALRGGIVLCGGKNKGVPNAAAKGAKRNGGLSVAISPDSSPKNISKYIDIPILTGVGFARNQIIAFSADAIISIGGGVGTFCEMAYGYAYSKPIIVIRGLKGMPEPFIGKYMDSKKKVKIIGANNAKNAVELAFKLIKKK